MVDVGCMHEVGEESEECDSDGVAIAEQYRDSRSSPMMAKSRMIEGVTFLESEL